MNYRRTRKYRGGAKKMNSSTLRSGKELFNEKNISSDKEELITHTT